MQEPTVDSLLLIVVGASAGALVLIMIIIIFLVHRYHRRRTKNLEMELGERTCVGKWVSTIHSPVLAEVVALSHFLCLLFFSYREEMNTLSRQASFRRINSVGSDPRALVQTTPHTPSFHMNAKYSCEIFLHQFMYL